MDIFRRRLLFRVLTPNGVEEFISSNSLLSFVYSGNLRGIYGHEPAQVIAMTFQAPTVITVRAAPPFGYLHY